MKCFMKMFVTIIFIMSIATPVNAKHLKNCRKYISDSYVACDSELPLVYSDQFTEFNTDQWISERGKAKVKRNEWLNSMRDTVTSMDYSDHDFNSIRVVLRYKAYKWHHSEFTINFIDGEELIFAYNKVKVQKRRKKIIRKRFSSTAWPEFSEGPLIFKSGKSWWQWRTLAVEYNNETGMVYIDTDNDCSFDFVQEWKTGLQFSHVTISNQKVDHFELYAAKSQAPEDPNSAPAYQLEWGGLGDNPKGLATDSSGFVYVADTSNNRIKKFDNNGMFLEEWLDFNRPEGIAIDADNLIYIADSGTNTIKKYDTNGVFISELPSFGDGYGSLQMIKDVAVDDAGDIYVPSFNFWFGNKVYKFTNGWTFAGEIAIETDSIITGLDVDTVGNLYITTGDSGIQKYDSDGNYMMDYGKISDTDAPGEFYNGSCDVFIDDQDRLYATDGGDNNRIQVFNLDGEYLYEWGTSGTGTGEFNDPNRIAVNAAGIFILDAGNLRVQKFQ